MINLYGSQESRQSADEIREGWETILEEIVNIEAKKELIIVIGDLNRHVSDTLIKGNHKKSTLAGRLLVEFVSENDYVLVNSLDCVDGGPFTRFDRN